MTSSIIIHPELLRLFNITVHEHCLLSIITSEQKDNNGWCRLTLSEMSDRVSVNFNDTYDRLIKRGLIKEDSEGEMCKSAEVWLMQQDNFNLLFKS